MGTVNQKGHKKLPPAPVALNEIEIENFGLEDLDSEEPEVEANEEGVVILDSEETDRAAAAMDAEVERLYKGFKVDDMIKVTAKNKFFNEDGIVRRLKGGKLMIRFYTYGSMFDEWLDPDDVRKLSDVEVLKGLGGPSQPITQYDFDGPRPGERQGDGDDRGPRDRRNMAGQLGGETGPRNQRQGREGSRFQRGDSLQDQRRNEDNWNWYKDNERRGQGGAYEDGEYDMRGSNDRRQNKGNDWAGPSRGRNDRQSNFAQGDVDSQWGRTPQPENRRRTRDNAQQGGKDDWSAFVSPASSPPSQVETDDFFASLMNDLSNDLDGGNGSKKGSSRVKDSDASSSSSDEDDFFASLMSEISESEDSVSSPKESGDSSTDDFFASLDFDLKEGGEGKKSVASSDGDDLDDFFADFVVADAAESTGRAKKGKEEPNSAKLSQVDELDDFIDNLAADSSLSESKPVSSSGETDDFFASLEAELEMELSTKPEKIQESAEEAAPVETKQKKSSPKSPHKASESSVAVDLKKLTVPALKDMLRERGLKVSGKKEELIQRLSS